MRVVVGRREVLDDGAELALRVLPACEPEIRDPERLADRCLLWLEPLRLLERHCRLGRQPLPQALLPFSEQVIRVTQRFPFPAPARPAPALLSRLRPAYGERYGKFSRITSTGDVRSRVLPIWIADTVAPASTASLKTSWSS